MSQTSYKNIKRNTYDQEKCVSKDKIMTERKTRNGFINRKSICVSKIVTSKTKQT